jgi:serine/threonine protein kinase
VALRYQRQKLLADHAGVKTYQGIDPLTGLPVLIYVFSGKPHLLLKELESENIPGVLDLHSEGQQSYVVVAYARGYKLAARPLEIDETTFLIEGARALKDAAEIGVLHGDIRPERFWVSSDHVFLEGFGLPWMIETGPYKPPEHLSSFAGDVYSWAKSALDLTHPPAAMKSILELCLNQEPNLRPTAEQLYSSLLKAKTQPSASVVSPLKTTEPRAASAKTLEIDFSLSDEEPTLPAVPPSPVVQPTMQGLPKPPSKTLSDLSDLDIQMSVPAPVSNPPSGPQVSKAMPAANFPSSFEDDTLEPMVLQSDPGLRQTPKAQAPLEERVKPKSKAADSKQPFVKDLPPGATYRAGKADANPNVPYKETPLPPTFEDVFLKNKTSRQNTRRTYLLLGLFLGALILIGLVFFRQRTFTATTDPDASALNYIVDVAVEPVGLSRVDLRIISSPAGSKRKAGDILTTVPNKIVLDQPGIWEFQGEFQELRSEVVRLQLPDQRSMLVVMPVPPVTPTEEPEEPVDPTTPAPENP